ncbi:large ribosomal subunit protein eL31-like [Ochotona princeps]|uniref:large ribosomal subunit protein eL31-like n=1 Tax=Ochotona princeps TaxID=9978 RepID=UPI0027154E66|nr:large ribosomal subunit protein eL31-like [Ochotona princeps]
MVPAKEGGEKTKSHSASSTINKVMTEYTISIHKRIHRVHCKKLALQALKEIQKLAKKEMGTPAVGLDIRLNKSAWAKGVRTIPYRIPMRWCRKHADKDLLNKLYTLVPYIPIIILNFPSLHS